jgi:hypothetical protein
MTKSTILIVLVVLVFMTTGCVPQPGDEGYAHWVEDYSNGMRTKQALDDLIVDLQYQPSEYVYMQRHGHFEKEGFSKEKNELGLIQYYTLTLQMNDRADLISSRSQSSGDKQRMLYYFSYLFQQDIQLKQNDRLLPCVLYHFERNSDLQNTHSFVLGFENTDDIQSSLESSVIVNSPLLNELPVTLKVTKPIVPFD